MKPTRAKAASTPPPTPAPPPESPAQPAPEIATLQATLDTFRVVIEEQQTRIAEQQNRIAALEAARPASSSDDNKLQPLKKLLPPNIDYKNVALPAAARGELKIKKPSGRLLSTAIWVQQWLANTGRG
jgi:hypothetical protein